MNDTFDFTDGGRTFSCAAEGRPVARGESPRPDMWWWFRVSGDRHRYAPFRAVALESHRSVQTRIVSYYADLMERRGLPPSAYPR